MITAPKNHLQTLQSASIDTPLGPMLAISDEDSLILLEFTDRRGLSREVERLQMKMNASVIPGKTSPIRSIELELHAYFAGKLSEFKTPLDRMGSEFQKKVWHELQKIPMGQTQTYLDIAKQIDKPTASRAVAQANASNQLAIVIPCHRVINSNGEIGGYSGGVWRKEWLIRHENEMKNEELK